MKYRIKEQAWHGYSIFICQRWLDHGITGCGEWESFGPWHPSLQAAKDYCKPQMDAYKVTYHDVT